MDLLTIHRKGQQLNMCMDLLIICGTTIHYLNMRMDLLIIHGTKSCHLNMRMDLLTIHTCTTSAVMTYVEGVAVSRHCAAQLGYFLDEGAFVQHLPFHVSHLG